MDARKFPSLLLWNKKWVHTHFYACQARILSYIKCELGMHRSGLSNSWLMPKDHSLPKHATVAATGFCSHILLATPAYRLERAWWQAVHDRRQLTGFSYQFRWPEWSKANRLKITPLIFLFASFYNQLKQEKTIPLLLSNMAV